MPAWVNLLRCLGFLWAAFACFPLSVRSEDPMDVLPAHPRDERISSPETFFGHKIGLRHLRHHEVVSYWKYLAENSERVALIDYGQTHGHRPLVMAVITSPANQAKLDSIRLGRRRLTSGKFAGDIAKQSLVMYMGYSVHGDEASGMNAAPLVAYHLASSVSDEMEQWLEQGIYLIDPALNPDGSDRFANWANENRGRFASASGIDREHTQPWPGGRRNYYWFDLNRDWLPLVHPESRGRLRLFHQWKPNVVLDFHEMSGSSSFFFQPGIPERNNPLTPAENLELTRAFAQEHALSMDLAGESFYTEERFDDFYMEKEVPTQTCMEPSGYCLSREVPEDCACVRIGPIATFVIQLPIRFVLVFPVCGRPTSSERLC